MSPNPPSALQRVEVVLGSTYRESRLLVMGPTGADITELEYILYMEALGNSLQGLSTTSFVSPKRVLEKDRRHGHAWAIVWMPVLIKP